MKVLAINSSPRMDKGNTDLILQPFLDGMREAGAEVNLFYTRNLTINPCIGCFHCWLEKPGECCQDDDLKMLFPKFKEADIQVWATPLYVDGMTGPMKNLLDRIIPLAEPFIVLRDGHCRHPARSGKKDIKVVLVSNCGFWEMDNFDPIIAHIKAYCMNLDGKFAGALLRPHGEAMRPMMEMGLPISDIFEAAKEAGRQLIVDGKMKPETLGTVSRELVPMGMWVEMANGYIRDKLERAKGSS